MPIYKYKVRDTSGKLVYGQMEAVDNKSLRKKLDDKNYFLIEYEEKTTRKDRLQHFAPFLRKTKLTDISIFSWQLNTMLDAGMPLINCLKIIKSQTKDKKFCSTINDIIKRIEEGSTFSEALKMHQGVFSKIYVQMINAGEVGGVLDEMVRRLAVYHEKQTEVRSNIKSALSYPIILFILSISVAIFLVVYVLPKFVFILQDIGANIPFTTQIMLNLSLSVINYWYIILAIIFFIAILYKFYTRTYSGRFTMDKIKLKIPVIGELIKKNLVVRFSNTLSILLSSGIPLLVSLEVVMDTIGNLVFINKLREVSNRVRDGKSIADPLENTNLFPNMVVNMIRVGEETGELDKLLAKISDFYTRDVNSIVNAFTKVIEPLLIVMMTIIIGFIAISIFLPLTDIMHSLHQ